MQPRFTSLHTHLAGVGPERRPQAAPPDPHVAPRVYSGINLGINHLSYGTAPFWVMPQCVVHLAGVFTCWRLFQNHTAQIVRKLRRPLIPVPKWFLNSSSLSQALFSPSIYIKTSVPVVTCVDWRCQFSKFVSEELPRWRGQSVFPFPAAALAFPFSTQYSFCLFVCSLGEFTESIVPC